MIDKQLRSLSKKQLLRLLYEQELEIERLTEENAMLTKQSLNLEQAGSLAEASLVVSGIMEAAQSAADVYLDSIRNVEVKKLGTLAKLEEEAKVRAIKAAESRVAGLRAQLELLITDILRTFDNHLSSIAALKGELADIISRNELSYLVPGTSQDNAE